MMKVAAYTGGDSVPSARYRVRQLVEPLRRRGVDIVEYPARFGSYPPRERVKHPVWGAMALVERAVASIHSWKADVTLLQREMLSKLFTVERLTHRPRVLDVDDAIWLLSERTAERLARSAELVVCGNAYLRERFAGWNPTTTIIPTAVDVSRFRPAPERRSADAPVIGWSGTSSGHAYLAAIEPALRRVLASHPSASLRIISDRRPRLTSLPAEQVVFVPWSPEVEVTALQDLSIGIMPLEDSEWARGKCSFKMLTYMACGVPVVASNVGMNADIFGRGACGLPAKSETDWVDALDTLLASPAMRAEAGAVGRRIVENEYSTEVVADALASALNAVAAHTPSR
jgi:glycosyltransferase involved in cell wall biosynthesis